MNIESAKRVFSSFGASFFILHEMTSAECEEMIERIRQAYEVWRSVLLSECSYEMHKSDERFYCLSIM